MGDLFNAASSPLDALGGSSAVKPNTATSVDRSGTRKQTKAQQAADDANVAKARDQARHGNVREARTTISNIEDPTKRQQAEKDLNDSRKDAPPNSTLQADGSGGLGDPLALFFMMVFYLKEATPTFKWDDVLKTAAKFSNQTFEAIQPTDGVLPQRSFEDSGNAKAGTGVKGQFSAQKDAATEDAKKKQEAQTKALQTQRDAKTENLNATRGAPSSGKGGNAGPVVVWPIQCMPVINSGLNKTVDWPNNQVATLAEPTIALNKGSSAIEIDVEFTYAVGVYGVGDGEITAMTGNIDPTTDQPDTDSNIPDANGPGDKSWTIEEVMGMMYLATSLVYPFNSSPVVSSPADRNAPPAEDKRTSAQFPVVFLRHYSLFPFLTPFVVKGVKIEPDENQPLVITEPKNLNKSFKTHLTYPAVRQIVKITLSLVSAHYYLPIFGGKDQDNQIQQQTSGETYLKLSKSLLGERIP